MLTVLNWVSSTGLIINGVREIIITAGKLQSSEKSNQNGPVWPDTTNQVSIRRSVTETRLGRHREEPLGLRRGALDFQCN